MDATQTNGAVTDGRSAVAEGCSAVRQNRQWWPGGFRCWGQSSDESQAPLLPVRAAVEIEAHHPCEEHPDAFGWSCPALMRFIFHSFGQSIVDYEN
ncbi:MAG: hypothetical protein ACREYE_06605 [Gammaproteobacteria bacterium]